VLAPAVRAAPWQYACLFRTVGNSLHPSSEHDAGLPTLLEKGDKFTALDQMRPLTRKDRETVLDPVSQRIAVDLEGGSGLLDR